MAQLGLEAQVVDQATLDRTIERFRQRRILLPTFAQLADPSRIPPGVTQSLAAVDPDAIDPLNLFRIHWFNGADRRRLQPVPDFVELPGALTGVPARIVVALGNRFPLIEAHKVLAAYGCLVPRLVTGQFDVEEHRAVWPSTGNYCRGGIALSRILGCRGVALLPEGMSRERFEWLERWVLDPEEDIVRTPGSESNVKEIYDACAQLDRSPQNIIFNQFSEFGNHLAHVGCTGPALECIFQALEGPKTLRAFVSATGSAGTIGAGDYLKERHGAVVAAVEALECPTLLYNGYGEHNIQGIGDKHVPLIHNIMNTDVVIAVSDRATDALGLLFNSEPGRQFLAERWSVPSDAIAHLDDLGLSSICNVLAAIKLAKYFHYGPDDVVLTVATDGASMYGSERAKTLERVFGGRFDHLSAAETAGRYLGAVATDHLRELRHTDRNRLFNLGYFTWVEQQGVDLEVFEARRQAGFWRALRPLLAAWDDLIEAVNRAVGATER